MAKTSVRLTFLQGTLGLASLVILARAFQLQVVQGDLWAARVEHGRSDERVVEAPRGTIYDRNGRALALSEEQYRVTIALNEVADTAALRSLIAKSLAIGPAVLARQFSRATPYFYGPFTAEQVEPLRHQHGVHFDVLRNRVYPQQTLAARLLGRLDQNGNHGIEGVEKLLDTVLAGKAGTQHFLLDARGNHIAAPGKENVEPVPGHDVTLTIDADLQGIAEGALRAAIEKHRALGGDVVIMDVRTGELLAVASLRTDSATGRLGPSSAAIVEPNEPGSTSKIFTVAALLRSGVDTNPVQVDGKTWQQDVGGRKPRTITDEHALYGPVTLGMTVQHSSNIAISKFALRLSPSQQFDGIRDFGFGTAPALGFPGEAPGTLRPPARWQNPRLTQPSLGQGYEWEATAVQLASGYGAIANRGYLMAPSLIRSVVDHHGEVQWQHRPDTVRRAVPDSIAHILINYLALVTDSGGTGTKAQLDKLRLVGKTGTAQRRHAGGGYRSSFVAIFPADAPQAVIYAMVDHPTDGVFYGGDVAAPIVHTVVQQALATMSSSLDRSRLETRVVLHPRHVLNPLDPSDVHTVQLPARPHDSAAGRDAVPDVAGESAREAVASLQRAGFEVKLVGRARVRLTAPAAGDSVARGSIVTVLADTLR